MLENIVNWPYLVMLNEVRGKVHDPKHIHKTDPESTYGFGSIPKFN